MFNFFKYLRNSGSLMFLLSKTDRKFIQVFAIKTSSDEHGLPCRTDQKSVRK